MDQTIRMLEKFTEYELKVSELYMLYSRIFQEDSGFWSQMSMEEQDHAALIRSSIVYVQIGKFPRQMTYDCMEDIEEMLGRIDARINQYTLATPGVCEAYRFALQVERSPCEKGFRVAMLTDTDDRVMKIMQAIGNMDTLHYARVETLVEKLQCTDEEGQDG